MNEEFLYVGADVEPSSLRAHNNDVGTDVVCTDQLVVAVNDMCPTWWAGALIISPSRWT